MFGQSQLIFMVTKKPKKLLQNELIALYSPFLNLKKYKFKDEEWTGRKWQRSRKEYDGWFTLRNLKTGRYLSLDDNQQTIVKGKLKK